MGSEKGAGFAEGEDEGEEEVDEEVDAEDDEEGGGSDRRDEEGEGDFPGEEKELENIFEVVVFGFEEGVGGEAADGVEEGGGEDSCAHEDRVYNGEVVVCSWGDEHDPDTHPCVDY